MNIDRLAVVNDPGRLAGRISPKYFVQILYKSCAPRRARFCFARQDYCSYLCSVRVVPTTREPSAISSGAKRLLTAPPAPARKIVRHFNLLLFSCRADFINAKIGLDSKFPKKLI
jgi:hypothetical protein